MRSPDHDPSLRFWSTVEARNRVDEIGLHRILPRRRAPSLPNARIGCSARVDSEPAEPFHRARRGCRRRAASRATAGPAGAGRSTKPLCPNPVSMPAVRLSLPMLRLRTTSPPARTSLPSGWIAIEVARGQPTCPSGEEAARRREPSADMRPAPLCRLTPQAVTITTVNSPLGPELRLHRPRRDPARQGQLALPRRRGRLLAGPVARARGLPPGRGRGRDHVRPPRAPGPRGGPADGPDLLHLRGRLRLRDRGRDDAADRRSGPRRGAAPSTRRSSSGGSRRCSSSTSRAGSSTTPPGTTAASSPTSSAARSTSPRPTGCSRREGQRRPAAARQRRDRPRDAGDRGPHPRLPPGPQDGQQGRRRRRPCPRPRLRPRRCIAVGDSVEDLEVAAAVGRFFVVANGPERDPGLRAALAAWDNATVTEGAMGDGFYEAVVSTLVERR